MTKEKLYQAMQINERIELLTTKANALRADNVSITLMIAAPKVYQREEIQDAFMSVDTIEAIKQTVLTDLVAQTNDLEQELEQL